MSDDRPVAPDRPRWTDAIRHFLPDVVGDDRWDFPEDGRDDDLLDEIEQAVNDILCRTYRHEIIDDQCMIPEHRYCVYCGRLATTLPPEVGSTTPV